MVCWSRRPNTYGPHGRRDGEQQAVAGGGTANVDRADEEVGEQVAERLVAGLLGDDGAVEDAGVELGQQQAPERVLGRLDDRFSHDVEGRVEQQGNAGALAEGAHQVVVRTVRPRG